MARSTGSVLPEGVSSPLRAAWCGPFFSTAFRPADSSFASFPARPAFVAAPRPLVPKSSGMRRPTPSEGSFLKVSHICLPVPTGSLAVRTIPVTVELSWVTYSAGWVML